MSYLICSLNFDNKERSLHKIAENEKDLNVLNIIKENYKIINVSIDEFNAIKLGKKSFVKYNNNEVFYEDLNIFFSKESLNSYLKDIKNIIKEFLENNTGHEYFNQWNSYLNQLNNLDLNSITYPLNKSLEQYFNDLGKLSLNTLQIP
jgi:hypothetical protein